MFISIASQRSPGVIEPQIEHSLARSRADLEEAFRLVHHSYVRAGLDPGNDSRIRLIRHHFLSSTEVVIAKHNGVIVSTATLIGDGDLGLPAESMYGEEIRAMQSRGLRIAEVGCLADRRKSPARFIQMFKWMSTLIAQAAEARGYNALVAATHPRHSRFYTRRLGFEVFGEIKECPYAQGNPAVAMVLDFEAKRGSEIHDHLFGKKYTAQQLAPHPWDSETRQHFGEIIDQIESPAAPATMPLIASIAPAANLNQPHSDH